MWVGVGCWFWMECFGVDRSIDSQPQSIHCIVSRCLQVMAARAQGRPYSIVFVGINGVGKSTSLSKVCYYLKSHGLKVSK